MLVLVLVLVCVCVCVCVCVRVCALSKNSVDLSHKTKLHVKLMML